MQKKNGKFEIKDLFRVMGTQMQLLIEEEKAEREKHHEIKNKRKAAKVNKEIVS